MTLGRQSGESHHHREGSYDQIIEKELHKIHTNIDEMIQRTESDLRYDGDASVNRIDFGQSSHMLNQDIDLELQSYVDKSQVSTKQQPSNRRALDHDYAK